jgi:hypothetical protein
MIYKMVMIINNGWYVVCNDAMHLIKMTKWVMYHHE